MSDFELGWIAAERGQLLNACPFERGGRWITWRAGWRAFMEAIER